MAAEAIATVGSTFVGRCSSCDGEYVTGTMTTGEFIQIENKNICVTGSVGTGSCGHTCTAVGQSTIMKINNKNVARVGDPVTGTIVGTITSGCDFLATE